MVFKIIILQLEPNGIANLRQFSTNNICSIDLYQKCQSSYLYIFIFSLLYFYIFYIFYRMYISYLFYKFLYILNIFIYILYDFYTVCQTLDFNFNVCDCNVQQFLSLIVLPKNSHAQMLLTVVTKPFTLSNCYFSKYNITSRRLGIQSICICYYKNIYQL